jgi:hypothetical protein
VAGKRRASRTHGDVDTFGDAIRRKKKTHEESYKIISTSISNIKGVSNGSVYDSNKKRCMISQVYPGMTKPKNKNYPTIRAQAVPYTDIQKSLASPSSNNMGEAMSFSE